MVCVVGAWFGSRMGLIGGRRDDRGRHLDHDEPDLGQVAQRKVEIGHLELARRLAQDGRVADPLGRKVEEEAVCDLTLGEDADDLDARAARCRTPATAVADTVRPTASVRSPRTTITPQG